MSQLFEFSVKHWDLTLTLLIILTLLYGGGILRRIRGINETDPAGAVRLINHLDAVMVDVREESEVKEGHIADSIHIPLGAIDSRIEELVTHRNRPVILVCRSGHRSGVACGKLRKNGFETVYNMRGGVMAWQSAGLPFGKPEKKGKKQKNSKSENP